MTFSDHLFVEYGKNAEILAAAPEAAGDRLATAMSNFKDVIGEMLRPIGAGFQSVTADIVKGLTAITKAMNNFFGIGSEGRINMLEGQLKFFKALDGIFESIHQTISKIPGFGRGLKGTAGFEGTKMMIKNTENLLTNLKEENQLRKDANDTLRNSAGIVGDIGEMSKKVGDAIRSSMVDAIEALITKSKSLGDIFSGLLRQIARMYLTQAIGSLPLPGLNAKGNVYAQNGIVPFAQGGIVDKPTIFPFANGTGLMGEAGPEAIMPLARGADGKLGVEAIDRYRPVGSTSSGGEGEVGEGGGGTGGTGGIDVRFNTEIINDVSYVTLSQFQEGVREAAKRGAKEGEAGALNRLRNSPSTRRKVGV